MLKQRDLLYKGKAKDVYLTNYPNLLVIEHSDRDYEGKGEKAKLIPNKGKTNNIVSEHVFLVLERLNIDTHFIRRLSETAMLVKKSEIIPLEVICLNKSSGNFCNHYGCKQGMTFSTGMEFCLKNKSLDNPIMPTSSIIYIGIASPEEIEKMEKITKQIRTILKDFFLLLELELIDFKLEFGRFQGDLIICDEISLDTCRFVDIRTGGNLDKDMFSKDIEKVEKAYRKFLEKNK